MEFFFRQSQSRFRQYRRLGKVQMLLEMADAIVSRDSDFSGVRIFLSQNKFKEGGLAVAVSTDQTQAIAGIHLKSDVSEKLAREIRLRELVDLNHNGFFH